MVSVLVTVKAVAAIDVMFAGRVAGRVTGTVAGRVTGRVTGIGTGTDE